MKLKRLLNEIADSQKSQEIKKIANEFIDLYNANTASRPTVIINTDYSVSFTGGFFFNKAPYDGTFGDFFSEKVRGFKIKAFEKLRAISCGLKDTNGFSDIEEITMLDLDKNEITEVNLTNSINKWHGPRLGTPYVSLGENKLKNLKGFNIKSQDFNLYLIECTELESLEGLNTSIDNIHLRYCNQFKDDLSKYKIKTCQLGILPENTSFPLFYVTLFNRPNIDQLALDKLPSDLKIILDKYRGKPEKAIDFINDLINEGYEKYLPNSDS